MSARVAQLVLDRQGHPGPGTTYQAVDIHNDPHVNDLNRTYLCIFSDGTWGYRTLRALRANPVEVAP